jgi:V/A-type H+-transporting ATPase subunit E
LADKKNASLIISENTVTIDGGFILKYGDVEENCSFDALFSSAKEELSDRVNAILFE